MKLERCSLTPLRVPYLCQRPIDGKDLFGREGPLEVEIGFGMGEVLMERALQYPETNFLGIEQHWERICKTLRAMARRSASFRERGVENIRIIQADARVVFERLVAPRSIDGVYSLFPCPWPKKGHVKHRLFNKEFLMILNNRLKDSGTIKIVTDSHPYFQWMMGEAADTGFEIDHEVVEPAYNTKFEKKWKAGGQVHFFEIRGKKIRHLNVPVKEEGDLKSYKLEKFNADQFYLEDFKGETTVIFKEAVFDREKERMMILALVAEGHLTQHLWIAVMKKAGAWQVVRADGQNFLPTPGMAKAVALVYEAAQNSGGI